jgi:two-component system chemotaxis sensor kinase CheA
MSTGDEEFDEIWELFEQDVARALDEAEEALLELGSEPEVRCESINRLYRGLHSIKGNARAMGWAATEAFTHTAEDLVALCRDGDAELDGAILDALLEALDRLRSHLPAAVAGRVDISIDDDPDLVAVKARLSEWCLIYDTSGSRQAATDEDFLFFDDFEDAPVESAATTTIGEPDLAEPSTTEPTSTEATESTEAPVAATDVVGPAVNEPERVEPAAGEPAAAAPRITEPMVPEPAARRSESPPPAPEAAPPRPEAKSADDNVYVQIKATRVRELLALASDLGLAADVVITDERVRDVAADSGKLAENLHRLRRLTRDLRYASSALALVPIADLFNRLRRVARDLARQTQKDFDVVVKGEATEIDRFLIDHLYDPLMHIMRNAVDHGLERAEDRERAGKPRRGVIQLSASNSGQGIMIEVQEDGAGLNRDAIVAKARKAGLVEPDADGKDLDLGRLILMPGFSTKEAVTNLSGRGVGLDVVNQAVRELRGILKITSEPGRGTSFRLQLPLTLTFADVLLVEEDGRSYAIPMEHVRRIVKPTSESYIRSATDATEYVRLQERSVPLVRLDRSSREIPETVVAIHTSHGPYALPVHSVIGTAQVTLRPLSRLLSGIRGAAACGLLSNGEVAIALDCESLVNHASV